MARDQCSLWLMSGGLVFGLPQVSSESPRARIVGRVLSTEGRPLSRAIVTAQKLGGSALFQAKTDRSGRYAMDVEPGRYIIRAEKGGYVTSEYRVEEASLEPTPMMVEAGKSVTVDLRLPRGGVITGRIVDEDGEPVVGAAVEVERRQEEPSRGAPWVFGLHGSATTDDRGIYRIYELASGVTTEGLVVHPGARVTDVVIVLSNAGAVLRGRVLSSEGDVPLPDAVVQLIPVNFAQRFAERGTVGTRSIVSDQHGGYEIKGIPPGRYYLLVLQQRPTFRRQEEFVEFLSARAA